MNKLKLIYSSVLAAIVSVIFVTVITIWAELSEPLKNWLKSTTGHHWTTKSIFSFTIYILVGAVVYFLTRQADSVKVRKFIVFLIITTILGVIAILGFFSLHYFKLF